MSAGEEVGLEEECKGTIEQVFGECGEVLDTLLQYLTNYLEVEEPPQAANISVLTKVLQALELLLRNERYRTYIESSPEIINNVLKLFERVTSNEARVSALRLIASIGITPESRVEICRRDGFKKVLQLMLDKDEDLSKEVARTVKHFLHIKVPTEQTQHSAPTLRQKVKKVFKGVAKLASTMFPPEGQTGMDLEGQIQTEIENPLPSEKMIRKAVEEFQTRKEKFVAEEQHSASGTPIQGHESAHPPNEDAVKESMRVQGVLSTIVKALQQAAIEVQLDLMETLSILLANNVRNQREFSKLQGYQFISEGFDKVKDYPDNPQSRKFLDSCFGILRSIMLNGNDSKVVQNFSALEVVLHLAAASIQTPVANAALSCLKQVLDLSWENALAMLDADVEKYLQQLLTRVGLDSQSYSLIEKSPSLPLSPLGGYLRTGSEFSFLEMSADERLVALLSIDQLMRRLAFLLGSSGTYNGKIPGLYVSVLLTAGIHMNPQVRELLLVTLAALISDLNARVPRTSVTILDRSTFLGAWVGLEHCAEAVLTCFDTNENACLKVLAHLSQYNLLYTELTLNSEFGVDRCLLKSAVEHKAFMTTMINLSRESQEAAWALERLLLSSVGCADLNWILDGLVAQGNEPLVSKILLLQDCPIVHQAKGHAFRKSFLRDSVLDFMQRQLGRDAVLYMLLAACSDSPDLKQYAVGYLTPTFLADQVPADELGLHALLDLCTETNYLSASGYLSHISSSFPNYTGPLFQQVMCPGLLFEIPHYEMDTSSSSSSISTPSLSTTNSTSSHFSPGCESLKLLPGDNIHALMRFLMRVERPLQTVVLHSLTVFSHSFHNKRVLHRLQIGKTLISMLNCLSPECEEAAVQLLERIFSYSMSLEEADLLLRILSSPESHLKALFMDLVCRLMRLELAPEFLSQANRDIQAATLTSFPSVKTGYSVLFWVKIRKHAKDFQPLFTWVNHSRGLVLFKLSYKHKSNLVEKKRNPPLRPSQEGLKHKLHFPKAQTTTALSAQVLSILSPVQDTSKHYELELSKDWTHICFTHHKNGLSLYIDGYPQDLYKCGYLNITKDKVCVTAVLGGERTEALFANVMCLEDVIEEEELRSIVRAGVNTSSPVLDQKVLFVVPEKHSSGNPFQDAEEVGDEKPMEPWLRYFPRNSMNREADDSVVHFSCPPKDAFNQASALAHFFSLIHSGEVSTGIRLVCHYITHNEQNYEEFSEKYGWGMLSACISRYSEKITTETLDYVVDAVCDSLMVHLKLRKMLSLKIQDVPEIPIQRVSGLCLILNLVNTLPADVTMNMLEALSNLMTRPANIQLFLSAEVSGLQFMLSLLKSMVQHEVRGLNYHLLATFERVLPHFATEQIEYLLDFLTSPDLKHHFSLVESELTIVISFICIHIATGNVGLLDKLLAADAGLLVFDLLSSPSESIRGAAIKLIGLFLKTSPRYKSWFTRRRGFDMMLAVLQKHRSSQATYQLLIALASTGLDKVAAFYPQDSGTAKTIMNRSAIADKTLPQAEKGQEVKKLVHVEALEVLLELLKLEDVEAVKTEAISGLENFLDPDNCEQLLECPFISWCASLVKADVQKPVVGVSRLREDRYQSQLYDFVTKLCVHDLNRPPKQFKFPLWLSKLPDVDFFSVRVFEGVLNEIERSLDTRKSDSNCLKNLSSLLQVTELPSFSPRVIHRVMHLVNNMACGSTPAVRTQMKSLGFFDLRDNLLIHLLRTESESEELMELLSNFSLDGLASQSKFRDSQAICYLVKSFLETESASVQLEVLKCLREQVCTQEDNRKVLKKVIESKALLQYLFNSRIVEAQSSMAVCFKSMKNVKTNQEDEELPEVFII